MDSLYDAYSSAHGTSADAAYQIRNALVHHEELFALIDYPKLLPLIVDVIGVNIQIRTSHVDVRPPMKDHKGGDLGASGSFFPWHADGPNYGYPITNGIIPFFEVKVGYYLTDLAEHNSGAICVVRGSHRRSSELIHDPNYRIDPEDIVEVNVRPGTAMLWRTALWHCLTPNLSDRTRKCLYYGYNHRWMRPGDYDRQDSDCWRAARPFSASCWVPTLRRTGWSSRTAIQLIRPLVTGVPNPEDVPLEAWAEEKRKIKMKEGMETMETKEYLAPVHRGRSSGGGGSSRGTGRWHEIGEGAET